MKKAYNIVLLLILGAWVAMAATVNITGTVTKTGGGALKDVTLTLSGVSGLSAKTGADGKFVLTSTRVIHMDASKSASMKFTLNGRNLNFSSSAGKISGNVSVFSGIGRQLFSMDFADLKPSSKGITLPLFTPGLNILRIVANNSTYTCPIIQEGCNLYLKESGSTVNNSFRIANSMADAVSDTIIAKKAGYTDKKTPINSYTLSDIAITMDSAQAVACNYTTLKEAGSKCGTHEILMGMAVSPSGLNTSVSNEFNYVTPENEMKWQNTEGSEGGFTYSQGDAIVTWAQSNNIKVKGHCLVWHSQLAGWVSSATGRERVLGIMKKHIEALMGHWGNKVYAWDVVNEAIATDSDVGTGNAQMRKTVFYNQIGPDYIPLAFKIAREYADSHNMKDMKLYYNDYSIDADNDKSKYLRTVVKQWVDSGVPIDGIGFQMHIGPPNNIPTAESVKDNMAYYASLGLEVLISEWDINLCGSKVTAAQQLQLYHDITKVCVEQPMCTAITIWGMNDSQSWLNSWSTALCNGANSQSLLFNNGQKKATYTQVLNALNGK